MAQPNGLFCPIRKEWVTALPEEHVRQRVLNYMISELKFPCALIAVEKSLRQLPHLSISQRQQLPDRRVDLLCFANGLAQQDGGLYPLLIVECKAVPLTPRVITQVVGYNHFVQACFIAVVNQSEIRTGWYNAIKRDYEFIPYLPSYEALLKNAQHHSTG